MARNAYTRISSFFFLCSHYSNFIILVCIHIYTYIYIGKTAAIAILWIFHCYHHHSVRESTYHNYSFFFFSAETRMYWMLDRPMKTKKYRTQPTGQQKCVLGICICLRNTAWTFHYHVAVMVTMTPFKTSMANITVSIGMDMLSLAISNWTPWSDLIVPSICII